MRNPIDEIINTIDAFLSDYFNLAIPDVRVTDLAEILIIAIFTYQLLKWVKTTRAWMLIRGLVIIFLFFAGAAILQMNTILWLGERLVSVAFVAIVVVFQPELRSALEHLGRNKFLNIISPLFQRGGGERFSDKTLNDIVFACQDMSRVKTGALIVIERDMVLGEYIKTGIDLDSIVSRQLLVNIFEKNTPLHDGAIIVRGDRVVAGTCYLPLSANPGIDKDLGTRHRAALGISEVSDSLTIVVSEETGSISLVEGGEIKHGVDSDVLREELRKFQTAAEKAEKKEEKGGEEDEK